MGYYGDILNEFDREANLGIKKEMITIILKAFPKKNKRELLELDINPLRGLYAQACKKLKQKGKNMLVDKVTDEQEDWTYDNYLIPDEEIERGRSPH